MKKKHVAAPSTVDSIRSATAYGGARSFFGLPFYVAATACFLAALLTGMAALSGGGLAQITGLLSAAGALLTGLFMVSIPALSNSIFDVADCALRHEAREAARDAKAAYEQYRQNEALLH